MPFHVDTGGLLVIDDSNFEKYTHDVVDGVVRNRGLVPRDFSAQPYGASTPYAIPLTTKSLTHQEMREIIEEKRRTRSTNRDVRKRAGLGPLNQQTTNYCHSADTEVLTNRGWVGWPNYNGVDELATMNPVSGMMEFQAPLMNHVFEHDGEMIFSDHNRLDFTVTPNHRMLVRKWDESKRTLASDWSFQEAGKLGWYCGLPSAPAGFVGTEMTTVRVADGGRVYAGDDFVRLVSLIVSDGWVGGVDKTKNLVSFACFREDRREEIAALAERVGFHEQPSRRGVWLAYGAELADWVRANCYTSGELGAINKKVPDIVKWLTMRQIRLFLDIYGDQSHNKKVGRHFFSTSKRAADDLQELCLRVGWRAAMWVSQPKSSVIKETGQVVNAKLPMHHVGVAETDNLSISTKQHIGRDYYKGPVFCATVPNGTLITRKNGRLLISGNCWINCVVMAFMVSRIQQGDEHVNLSPASIGALITNFQNVGGWPTKGLEFLVSTGAAPIEVWPANAIDRRYNTPASKAAREPFKATQWFDIQPGDIDALATGLLLFGPSAVALNWWRHAIVYEDPFFDQKGNLCVDALNSWGAWGPQQNGEFVLTASKMIPSEAVMPTQGISRGAAA